MAAIFQANTGYRDPAKTLTIKALEARMKAAQDAAASATQMTQPIASPWQGAAYLGNILAGQVQQSRAENADIAARDQLAKIKAGIDTRNGATPEQIADWTRLDPEGAGKYQQDQTDFQQQLQKLGAEQAFTHSENVGNQSFEMQKQDDAQKAAADAAAVAAGRATTENIRQEGVTAEQDRIKHQQEIDDIGQKTEARKAEWLRLHPGDDMSSPEAQNYILRDAGPPIDPFNTRQSAKDVSGMKEQAGLYDSTLDNLSHAEELLPNVQTGTFNLGELNTAMSLGEGPGKEYLHARGWTDAQIDATMTFNRILGQEAVNRMSTTLKGQTSNAEMAHFTAIINDPRATIQQRADAIKGLKSAILRDRSILSTNMVQGYGVDGLPEYSYDPSRMVAAPVTTAAPGQSATPPPSDAARAGVKVTIKPPPGG